MSVPACAPDRQLWCVCVSLSSQFNCLSAPVYLDNSQTKAKKEKRSFAGHFYMPLPPPSSSFLPCTCSWLFVHERSAGAPAEVAAADVPLASSLPGLVSTVTLHLEEGIYSVQSVCLCVRQSARTHSLGHARARICGICVCVFVGLHANTFLCMCAGAFSDYSNRSDSH